MGTWSKWELDRDRLPGEAIVFGGNTPRSSIDRIVGFHDRVLFHKHDNYEPFLVEADGRETLLAFQVYGAPLTADLQFLLADGGVETAVFIGAAYGIDPALRVADCVVPPQVRCLDGFCRAIGAEDWAHPDPDLRSRIVGALRTAGEAFTEAPTVSVPSTFFHGDESAIPREAVALEIELAAFLHAGALAGMSCAGILVVSDTARHTLRDDRVSRDERIIRVFQAVRGMGSEAPPA